MALACEADAVHHRLNDAANVVTSFTYECYDCFAPFNRLEELASHSITNAIHSEEVCLKCRGSVTVFYQLGKTIRLHSCNKSNIRHLNPDLHLQSQHLASKLNLGSSEAKDQVINCNVKGCPATFDASAEGIFRFLKHTNKLEHSTLPSCKKCSLPDFQLTFQGVSIISHYCPKVGRLVFVTKT